MITPTCVLVLTNVVWHSGRHFGSWQSPPCPHIGPGVPHSSLNLEVGDDELYTGGALGFTVLLTFGSWQWSSCPLCGLGGPHLPYTRSWHRLSLRLGSWLHGSWQYSSRSSCEFGESHHPYTRSWHPRSPQWRQAAVVTCHLCFILFTRHSQGVGLFTKCLLSTVFTYYFTIISMHFFPLAPFSFFCPVCRSIRYICIMLLWRVQLHLIFMYMCIAPGHKVLL